MKPMSAISFVMMLAGCRSPTTPSSAPPVVFPMLSGVVAEGRQPIPGASVDNGSGVGYVGATSDAHGAFRLPVNGSVDAAEGIADWVRAIKDGYAQPCAAPIEGNTINLQMVSLSALSGAPLPSPDGLRTVSGIIVRMTGVGVPQPVANAGVDFEPRWDDWEAAYTYSDAAGRFSLCGLPMDTVRIGAYSRPGANPAYVTVSPGQNNIEVTLP
jgi:hypothetical protein